MDKTENGGVELLKKLYDFAHNIDASRKITVGQYPNRLGSVTKKIMQRSLPLPNRISLSIIATL